MRGSRPSFPVAMQTLRGWSPSRRAVEAVLHDVEGRQYYAAHYEEALQLVCRAFLAVTEARDES